MNPIRIMSLHTAQAQALDSIGGGAMPEITQDIAAALCAGMPRHWYLTARLKWADDWSGANELEYWLYDYAVGVASKERWRVPKGKEYIRKMVGLAIAELASPRRFHTAVAKATWLEVSESQFSRTWAKRYQTIFAELEEWSNRAYRHIQKRQIEDELM